MLFSKTIIRAEWEAGAPMREAMAIKRERWRASRRSGWPSGRQSSVQRRFNAVGSRGNRGGVETETGETPVAWSRRSQLLPVQGAAMALRARGGGYPARRPE